MHLTCSRTKWHDVEASQRQQKLEQEDICKAEIPRILNFLKSASTITEVVLSPDEIADLPIRVEDRDQAMQERTPGTIFKTMSISCTCTDLGLWTLPSFPTIRVEHQPTRKALLQARQFSTNEVNAWRAFVASSGNPLYQAFDFTADFHSRDLTTSAPQSEVAQNSFIDLSPFQKGYPAGPHVNIDDFSMIFCEDLERNVQYFEEGGEWKPDLYGEQREAKGSVSSRLKDEGRIGEAAKAVLDRPVHELSEDMLQKVIDMMMLEDDEEVYFEERAICKRKKAKQQKEE